MAKGKKKSFIDKKNASTYHLLHRSQRDVANDVLEQGGSDTILWPSPHNRTDTDHAILVTSTQVDHMTAWRQRLADVGLLEEDPNRFIRPITGTGTFLNSMGHVADPSGGGRSALITQEDMLLEVPRQLESIPLTAEFMDEDIAAVLFGDDFDEGQYEALNDEFVLDAAGTGDCDEPAFDYDEHVRRLVQQARRDCGDRSINLATHAFAQQDQELFERMRPLQPTNLEDDSIAEVPSCYEEDTIMSTPGVVSKLHLEEERILCDKFEATLAEYDSDDIGEGADDDMNGDTAFEGDEQLDVVLDGFLEEKEDDFFMRGYVDRIRRTEGGSGFSALVGTRMVDVKELDVQSAIDFEQPESVEETLAKAKKVLSNPPQQPPTEEIFIDGKSYFSERQRNQWDCESILSTYSNLDNNPCTITPSRRKKKKGKDLRTALDESPTDEFIQLSKKTGLPIAVSNSATSACFDAGGNGTYKSINNGVPRSKMETAEEKRVRKVAVKIERQMARIQKKATRDVFQEEIRKRAVDIGSDYVAGKTVFRYS